jgi:ribonuclease HI
METIHTDYRITADGGSRGNGTPTAHGYGSYRLETRTGKSVTSRLQFGDGITSNVAEYQTVISALQDLAERITRAGKNPGAYTVEVRTDSKLIVDQIAGTARVKAQHLKPLHTVARELLNTFAQASITPTPRDEIVRILGH